VSYSFLMMKPRTAIGSRNDFSESALIKQEPMALVGALSLLFPTLVWSKTHSRGWFASLDHEETWYEFSIGGAPDYAWSIQASHRAQTRNLIPLICKTLGLVAFDGQAMVIVDAEGERPA
jgi:hypothetical protein